MKKLTLFLALVLGLVVLSPGLSSAKDRNHRGYHKHHKHYRNSGVYYPSYNYPYRQNFIYQNRPFINFRPSGSRPYPYYQNNYYSPFYYSGFGNYGGYGYGDCR